MWIVQSANPFVSTSTPSSDLTRWVEFQAPQGEQGPAGPLVAGNLGQTLFHNGTSWVANSSLYNSGTAVGIGTTMPTATLDVDGSFRYRGGTPVKGSVLTTDADGYATWEAPSYSNWTKDGLNIKNSNKGSVVINGISTTGVQSNLLVRQTLNPMSGSKVVLSNLSADFRQNAGGNGDASGIKFTVGNTTAYTGTAAIVAERTGVYGQGKFHIAVNNAGATGKLDIPIALTIDGPKGGYVGIGTVSPLSKLDVVGGDPTEEEPIFAVRNNEGQLVFGVYQSGVRMYVDDTAKKGNRGGFAVGGFSDQIKGGGAEYLRVTPDSVRVNVRNQSGTKGNRGGFAVGGFSDQIKRGPSDLFFIAPDSARFYLNDSPTKGNRGGFAVGGFSDQIKGQANYLHLNPDNYFIGHGAGSSIELGQYNIFIGYEAGYSTTGDHGDMYPTNGDNNIFIGYKAGYTNTIGEQNVYIGALSGRMNVDGIENTFVGAETGQYNTGYGNTFLGAYVGSSMGTNSGYGNTFLGNSAGRYNTSGYSNVFIGREAGSNNYTGSNNVYIGEYSGASTNSASNNVFIGNGVGRSEPGSNKLYIHNSNANSSNALIYGDFSSKQLRFNATAVGINAAPSTTQTLLVVNPMANNNAPAILGQHNVTANWGVGVKGVGGYKGVEGIATFEGAGTRYGVYAQASGGTTNWAGYFVGNVFVSGTLTNPSDINLKQNLKPIANAVEKIMQLNGVYFEWMPTVRFSIPDKEGKYAEGDEAPKGTQVGVIAQEVEKVLPEIVLTDERGIKSVDYTKLTPLLIQAIKEQQQTISNQNEIIEMLKTQNDQIMQRLQQIEEQLNK